MVEVPSLYKKALLLKVRLVLCTSKHQTCETVTQISSYHAITANNHAWQILDKAIGA